MTRLALFRRLRANARGAVAIEFALLGPAFIVMLLGVLQVGIGLQSYNALRNASADVYLTRVLKSAELVRLDGDANDAIEFRGADATHAVGGRGEKRRHRSEGTRTGGRKGRAGRAVGSVIRCARTVSGSAGVLR